MAMTNVLKTRELWLTTIQGGLKWCSLVYPPPQGPQYDVAVHANHSVDVGNGGYDGSFGWIGSVRKKFAEVVWTSQNEVKNDQKWPKVTKMCEKTQVPWKRTTFWHNPQDKLAFDLEVHSSTFTPWFDTLPNIVSMICRLGCIRILRKWMQNRFSWQTEPPIAPKENQFWTCSPQMCRTTLPTNMGGVWIFLLNVSKYPGHRYLLEGEGCKGYIYFLKGNAAKVMADQTTLPPRVPESLPPSLLFIHINQDLIGIRGMMEFIAGAGVKGSCGRA